MAPRVFWSDSHTPTSHGSMRDLIRLAHTHLAWLHAWPDQTRTHTHLAWLHAWLDHTRTHPPRMAPRVTWLDLHTPTTHGSLRDLVRLANTHLAWLHAWPDQTRTHPPRMVPRVTWWDLHTPTTHGSLRDLVRLANTHLAWLHAWPDQTRKHPPRMTPCVTWSNLHTPTKRDVAHPTLQHAMSSSFKTGNNPFWFFPLTKYFFFNRAHDF